MECFAALAGLFATLSVHHNQLVKYFGVLEGYSDIGYYTGDQDKTLPLPGDIFLNAR